MNRNAKYISNTLCLRKPQRESLEIFEEICDILKLQKNVNLDEQLQKVRSICPTLISFERSFPSVCFSLATGIGKTRLMGAFMAYLYYEKGIKNFFVMAPNLTIYNKLKADFGNNSNPKYVFKGLDEFINPPRIIDGDNYGEFRQISNINNEIIINVFNISKLNSDTKIKKGKPARIKRLNEVLGESYFEYLKNLPDLCILMDESHHYHADKSFNVINELEPILGIEVTATPQIQKGSKAIKFKNVVYEYSLAHALNDEKYIKVPVVVTRKDFHPEEFPNPDDLDKEKLKDGIKLHIDTKEALDTYARTHGKPIIKPFVLVVAKDIDHSKKIKKYLTCDKFYKGYYKDKVLEINSNQRGSEKDENISKLLTLEKPDNNVEIVIHVNMLKEGWDVNNLYTIIPLRASASETLTEQTIGRGLRLPYGERTGNEKVDRLSIVSHDKYEAIVKLAENPNSLVRKVYFIDPEENSNEDQKETIELPTVYDEITNSKSYKEQLAICMPDTIQAPQEVKEDIVKYVSEITNKSVLEMNKRLHNFEDIKQPRVKKLLNTSIISLTQNAFPSLELSKEDVAACVDKAVEQSVCLVTNKVIPIPRAVVQPVSQVKQGFHEFKLDTRNMNWYPPDDILLATELKKGGKSYSIDTSFANVKETDTPENAIVRLLLKHENIEYDECADLMYSLIDQLKEHFYSYLKDEDEVQKVVIYRGKSIADNIYAQMNEHFYKEETTYTATDMRPFSRIEVSFGGKYVSDDIYDYRANIVPQDVKSKIFKGFKKSCHSLYKFDNNTEKIFAIILERENIVLKWMRPSLRQFTIYYDRDSSKRYQPDFVVETANYIYMIETKDNRMLNDSDVVKKARAAMKYCAAATNFNIKYRGKPWRYVLISHEEVRLNSSFNSMVKNSVKVEQLT